MRHSFYYIIAVFFSIALGNQVPALAKDSDAQHVSGSGNSQPRKPMSIHISGSGSVTGYQSTIAHISGVKKPAPETAPAIPKVSPDKASAPAKARSPKKAPPRISRKKVLEMASIEDRTVRKKACWFRCEKAWQISLEEECSGKIDKEAKTCRREVFQNRLTCVRKRCSKIR